MVGPTYAVAQSRNKKSRKQIENFKACTKSHTQLYKSHIHSQKGWAAAMPPPIPSESSYLIYISAWVILSVGFYVFLVFLYDFLLRDCATTYFGLAILQYVNGGIGKDGEIRKTYILLQAC